MDGRFGSGGVYFVVTLYERNTHNLSFNDFIISAAVFIMFSFLNCIHAGFVCFTYSH